MFTGIITDIGRIVSRKEDGQKPGLRLEIGCAYPMDEVALGASIAVEGMCLTVADKGKASFWVDISPESLRCTLAGSWAVGDAVNLERALRAGDELGGHYVTGHVDGLAEIRAITQAGDYHELECEAPTELARFIAPKGSVSLGGISLTVNRVEDARFWLMIIPHTWQETSLRQRRVGDRLHLEIDLIARYLARMVGQMRECKG
jgi:riboflavin synthase